MFYLVIVNENGMAHLTKSECEGFYEMLRVQCSGWD
jgi:hypothetical protein